VEEEPVMFQGAPPRFDHGVRELQPRQGQPATRPGTTRPARRAESCPGFGVAACQKS
jgi:hypothetical protein